MQKILRVENYVRKKSYEKLHNKYGIRLPGILVPSKSRMSGVLKEGISNTSSNVRYSLYYVRKCKAFKFPLRPAYINLASAHHSITHVHTFT